MNTENTYNTIFRDFRGSVSEFRTLLTLLCNGVADQDIYGNPDDQKTLYDTVRRSLVTIHPTGSKNSIDDTDLGEYLYINSRYYRTARNQEPQTNYWDEWEV